MQIELNGTRREFPPAATVDDLIATLDLAGRRVAVEVNGSVVPASEHGRRCLAEGDRVELIGAIGGG
ncbi:MAG: sulfur carrier protein ThiS [Gammaproteobacteria bacterium]